MCNLLSLHYKVYCMFSFLSSKLKVLLLTDVFQDVASLVHGLVKISSTLGDGIFIGLFSVEFYGMPTPSGCMCPFLSFMCSC